MVWTLTIGSLKIFFKHLSIKSELFKFTSSGEWEINLRRIHSFIRFSCVAKRRISFGKKSKPRHSRDRRRKDINRKKNLEGKAIEHLHLFQE